MINSTLNLRKRLMSCALTCGLAALSCANVTAQTTLFFEDFEGLALGEKVDEGDLNDTIVEEAWNADGPEGWTVDRTGVPAGGVTEFRGWTFMNPVFWEAVAGQERGGFVPTGENVIAVADGDEWDDAPNDGGPVNTFMTTPAIDVSSGDLDIGFDASWRPDATQEARVRAVFDAGDPVDVMHWFSSEEDAIAAGFDGPLSDDELFGFKPDPIADGFPADEIIDTTISVPSGASTVQLEFGYLNAGNHWWFAVDNIEVGDDYSEDFEGVELGPNIDESRLPENLRGDLTEVWTDQAPEGWAIDDSGVPGFDDPGNDGVTEWAGWSFASKDWWIGVAGDQNRSQFNSGQGTVLIADPDEWDDQSHAPSEENGWYQTTIDTPEISLAEVGEGDEVSIQFDSSWRPEFDSNFRQSGRLVATFSDGTEAEIFEWRSADGNNTEELLAGSDDVANTYENGAKTNDEDLTFPVPVPDGAESVSFQFEMFDAGNDWWWAIDNVTLLSSGGGGECVPSMGDIDGSGTVDFADFLVLSTNFGTGTTAAEGDINCDAVVDFADFLVLSTNFGQAVGAQSVPEPTGLGLAVFAVLGLALRRRR